jgi:hypothetical protein
MLPLNHKRTTSSLAPPIFYVAKISAIKNRRLPIKFDSMKRLHFTINVVLEIFVVKPTNEWMRVFVNCYFVFEQKRKRRRVHSNCNCQQQQRQQQQQQRTSFQHSFVLFFGHFLETQFHEKKIPFSLIGMRQSNTFKSEKYICFNQFWFVYNKIHFYMNMYYFVIYVLCI